MIKFTVYIPSLFLSSDLPDITIATDHEAVNFRISIGSAVLLEGRYYAFNGNITVSDIVPLIQDNIAGNIDMNLVDVHLACEALAALGVVGASCRRSVR